MAYSFQKFEYPLCIYGKTCVKMTTLKKTKKIVFKTNYCLMQVKSIAEYFKGSILQGEHSSILLTFIKLSVVIKICVLSIFEWQFDTSFTVQAELGTCSGSMAGHCVVVLSKILYPQHLVWENIQT